MIPCSFLIWPSRVCHVLAGKSLHMWHWYIRPDRCFASTWLLRLLVTFAVKAQVVQTCRRPPTSSNVTDICRFTRSLISAQKPMSEPIFHPPHPIYLKEENSEFETFGNPSNSIKKSFFGPFLLVFDELPILTAARIRY